MKIRLIFLWKATKQVHKSSDNSQNRKDVKIFNLSSKKLNDTEMHILLRGLKFTPTPENRNVQEIRTDIHEFNRKIRLKERFHNKAYEQDSSVARNKSNFEPTKGRNEALDNYIESINSFPFENIIQNKTFNVTFEERKVIESLKSDKS